MALLERSEHYGELQRVVDYLFKNSPVIERLDVVIAADTFDVCADMQEIVRLLPPGSYTRPALCAQLNSTIAGHAWGFVYGTVE